MDPSYKPIYSQTQDLTYRVKDVADDPNDGTVQSLQRELKALMDDMENGRNPHSLEARVKSAQGLLDRLRAQGDGAMDYSHIDELRDNFEDMRQDIRELPNY